MADEVYLNTLLETVDVEGWYATDRPDVFVEIIDPSSNEPTEGGDWCTNVTVWELVTIHNGDRMTIGRLEADGCLMENTADTTVKDLYDYIESATGDAVRNRLGRLESLIIENLETI